MYLVPLSFFDLRELVIIQIVIRIHVDYLGLCGSAQHLNDLNQVVDAALADEEGRAVDHLQDDAADRPDIDHCCVVGGSED